ncbi:hypothetical protein C8T65DRAFT_828609 [Cerioporus squamosus]|nr:hypothetical protein C8T65DRAFT_828609 [Cerioporus squamosus]
MDPLRLNLEQQTQKLLDEIPNGSPYSAVLQKVSRPALLDTISALLRVPQLTTTVATLFRPLLLDLCARWLHQVEAERLDKFEALCLLLEVHPELHPVLFAFIRVFENERGPLCAFIHGIFSSVDVPTLHRILLAYYRILQANRTLPRLLGWPLAPLSQLIWSPHPDNGVRFLAIRCYALQVGMMEGERVKVEKEVLGEVSEVDCPIAYGVNPDGTMHTVDGWILPAIELDRITRARDALLLPIDLFIPDGDDSHEPIHPAELSPMIAHVHGILMLRSSLPTHSSSALIHTPTAAQSLREIALHLSMQLPVLLTSAPSAWEVITHLSPC